VSRRVARLARGVPLALPRLVRASDGRPAALATSVTLLDDGERLRVAFECEDPEPRATLLNRDGPLWEEEVVELFLAPGRSTPKRYYEFEINPLGTVFDAIVDSPRGDRRALRVDPSWDCPGLTARAEVDGASGLWRAELGVPWRSVAADSSVSAWRLNVYRVDRPAAAAPEFTAWSPTWAAPADFHRPAHFGILLRAGIE
jgi:hypothetical protein